MEPMIRRFMHTYWRFARGMTLGVRGVVIDGEGRILLVRHSYVAGWHFPGGGVETGETMMDALARELLEEANVAWTAPPALHGIFFNRHASPRDHVALYVIRAFVDRGNTAPNREIVERGFFDPQALPAETSAGTRARLAEILNGTPAADLW
jgi:ADP-ribose pyrophosphatase YjhB (NUDIX family)